MHNFYCQLLLTRIPLNRVFLFIFNVIDVPKSTCKSHQCSSNRGKSGTKIAGNGSGDCKFSDVENSFLNENQINNCDSHNNSSNNLMQSESFPILKTKNDNIVELSDHIQFLITEVSAPKAPSLQLENEPSLDDSDVLTEGKFR